MRLVTQVTDGHVGQIRTRRDLGPLLVSGFGLLLVVLVLAWLGVNLAKDPQTFFRVLLIGVSQGAVYALVALGYTLVYGILELINFAHGDVFMLGGMISATIVLQVFSLNESPALGSLIAALLVSLAAAIVACALLNATIERIAYKPLRNAPRLAPLITAIGVSFILQNVAIIWKGTRPVSLPTTLFAAGHGGRIFSIGHVVYTWDRLFVLLITVPVLVGLVWLVKFTRQGKAMRATAQDQDAARLMGIDVDRTIAFTFGLGGALAGAAGVLYLEANGLTRWDAGFRLGLIAFTAAVLGGIGNLTGAVLGGFLIGVIENVNNSLGLGQAWGQTVIFGILITLMVFKPEGILGKPTTEKV